MSDPSIECPRGSNGNAGSGLTNTAPLDRLLAKRYDYLSEGFIEYRGRFLDECRVRSIHETDRSVYVLLVVDDESAPYPADFGFLTQAENAALDRHVDLMLTEAWPQPIIRLGRAGPNELWRVIGEDLPAQRTVVTLRQVGFAQLWWTPQHVEQTGAEETDPMGLIWEAVVHAGHESLVPFLWGECETFLREKGCGRCFTTDRDPDYDPAAYSQLLERRGYELVERAGRARDTLHRCAVKTLR